MGISEKELAYLKDRYVKEQAEGISKSEMVSLLSDGLNDELIAETKGIPLEKVKYLKRRWELSSKQVKRSAAAYKKLSEDYEGTLLDKQICRLWGMSESSLYRQKTRWKKNGELQNGQAAPENAETAG